MVNLSRVFAGQRVGVRQITDRIWLVSFMDYDLGYFDDETCRLERSTIPSARKCYPCLRNNPLPMFPERTRWAMASLPPASWNQIVAWLNQIEALRQTT